MRLSSAQHGPQPHHLPWCGLSRVNSNGEHAPNTKYHRLLWVAMIARWRLCNKTQYEHAVKGKRVVEWGPI